MSPDIKPNTDRPRTTVGRRRALSAIGAGLLGLAAIPAVEARPIPDLGIARPHALRRRRLRHTALRDPKVEALIDEARVDGWTIEADDAIVLRTDDPDGSYHTVGIPMARNDARGAVLWTDDGPFPVQARRFQPLDGRRVRMDATLMRDRPVTGSSTIELIGFPCRLNWACVLSVAGAWASTVAACGACVSEPTRLTCLACIGTLTGALGVSIGCPVCR